MLSRICLGAALTLMALAGACRSAPPPVKVTKIVDGDTLEVLIDSRPERVRLHGVDCPERGQPYGTRAREFTAELAFGKSVTLHVRGRDRYGRTVARVELPDGRSLNSELVRAGLAWWYRKYAPDDPELERLEAEARAARRGLWADANPAPPWEWRSPP